MILARLARTPQEIIDRLTQELVLQGHATANTVITEKTRFHFDHRTEAPPGAIYVHPRDLDVVSQEVEFWLLDTRVLLHDKGFRDCQTVADWLNWLFAEIEFPTPQPTA